MKLLDRISSPEDVKKLGVRELRLLAEEIRGLILSTITTNGGHLSSNLGVIELTIALHRVFDSPHDAIVWDVGHQAYAHKLLTGRLREFSRIRKKGGLSGFPKRSESPHDIFDTGHSSTSISAALGLLEARRRSGTPGKAIAVIGDGALTGGMAYEALSNVAPLNLPLIVVLNDNKMSISRNVGALSRYLSRLSATVRYQTFRARIDAFVASIPFLGRYLAALIHRGKRAVKAVFFKDNLFADLGFEYVGPIDGHNIPLLLRVFEQVKLLARPVVVHIVTTKGKGFEEAEEDPEGFHGVSPSCSDAETARLTYSDSFGSDILKIAEADPAIVCVTAAMTKGTGLAAMKKLYPQRVYDVGIAEQHAVTFAAGLAAGRLKPVVAIYSTFMQRAVDQVLHDVALPDLPVIFAVDRAGAVGEDGETHQGFFDIALFRGMPNMRLLSPSCVAEMRSFLDYATALKHPVMIRYPRTKVECDEEACLAKVEEGRGVFLREREGSRVLVCALGPIAHAAARASDRLEALGLSIDVYSLRFANPLDGPHLAGICASYGAIVTVEEGIRKGGIGEGICSMLNALGVERKLHVLGFESQPSAQAGRPELLAQAGLDETGLTMYLSNNFGNFLEGGRHETIALASGK